MNRPIHAVLAATAFLICAALMASCASTPLPEPPPAPWPESPRRPPPPPPPDSSGAMVEEIIVTSGKRVISPLNDRDRAELGSVSLEEEVWIIAKASAGRRRLRRVRCRSRRWRPGPSFGVFGRLRPVRVGHRGRNGAAAPGTHGRGRFRSPATSAPCGSDSGSEIRSPAESRRSTSSRCRNGPPSRSF